MPKGKSGGELKINTVATSELARRLSLTPEQDELVGMLDGASPTSDGRNYFEVYPDLPNYLEEQAQSVRQFEEMEPIRFTRSSVATEKSIARFVHLYHGLTGIHTAAPRIEAFQRLEQTLGEYVDFHEARRGVIGWSDGYKVFRKRLRANLLEEIGETLGGDIIYLSRALQQNVDILTDPRISWLEPYKIHAAFARFDITDFLQTSPGKLVTLGLPTTPHQLQAGFYDTLEWVSTQVLAHQYVTTNPNPTNGIGGIDGAVGALVEQIGLGYLRGVHILSGEFQGIGHRQSYIHQDVGRHLVYCNSDEVHPSRNVPSASFDIAVFNRHSGDRIKIDFKKAHKRKKPSMPDIVRMKLKNTVSSISFLSRTARYAFSQERFWREGEGALSASELESISSVTDKLEFEAARTSHAERVGRFVLSSKT